MQKTLSELREIAAAIGYQILESPDQPDSFYLVKRIDDDACVVARINVEVRSRGKCTLEQLSDALGMAIEEFVLTLVGDIRSHYRDLAEVHPDPRMTALADAVKPHSKGSEEISRRTALELANELHELAMDLCKRSRHMPER